MYRAWRPFSDPLSPSHPNPAVFMITWVMLQLSPVLLISLFTPSRGIMILTILKILMKPSFQDNKTLISTSENITLKRGVKHQKMPKLQNSDQESMPDLLNIKNTLT
jgi:hypothetical protein